MNKLIDAIALQSDGLLRGNLEKAIADLDRLAKENDGAEVPITIKIVVEKDSVYRHGAKIKWTTSVKHEDETEMELFDPNQLKLPFKDEQPEVPMNKNPGLKICKSYAKKAGIKEGGK